jgi:hypothetical protein
MLTQSLLFTGEFWSQGSDASSSGTADGKVSGGKSLPPIVRENRISDPDSFLTGWQVVSGSGAITGLRTDRNQLFVADVVRPPSVPESCYRLIIAYNIPISDVGGEFHALPPLDDIEQGMTLFVLDIKETRRTI